MINPPKSASTQFKSLGEGFARKGKRIYVRVSIEGRPTWKSTKTNHLPDARRWREKWIKDRWLEEMLGPGRVSSTGLQKCSLTINQLIDEYTLANHPTIQGKRLKIKSPRSIRNEKYILSPLRQFFGGRRADTLTLKDCDAYHAWRLSGGYQSEFTVRGHTVRKTTKGGNRAVDLELIVLGNVLSLAVRREHLAVNPIQGRGSYHDKSSVRHCREVAPDPDGLQLIVSRLREVNCLDYANLTQFLAWTGLRIGEALAVKWEHIDLAEKVINVKRSKRGVCPFVAILPELAKLLQAMSVDRKSKLIFPSPFAPKKPLDASAFRRVLRNAAKKTGLKHVTPHGLRSFWVTQARLSGLTDSEVAYLIGDSTGPTIISQVYGDCRPENALAVARTIQLTLTTRENLKSKSSKAEELQ